MSPEIILLAIGCYLFCGVEEKIYRIKTGDWRETENYPDLEKKISETNFIPKVTTYENILEKFGVEYTEQRTHRVIRRQKYNGNINYFDKELRYVYRKVNSIQTKAAFVTCLNYLELHLFFNENVLLFHYVVDSRMDEKTCKEYRGPLNTLTDNDWLPNGSTYATKVYNCNKKFYEIFTLEHREKWDYARDCDFHNKEYWEDPVYKDKKYISDKNGWPCTGIFNTSC